MLAWLYGFPLLQTLGLFSNFHPTLHSPLWELFLDTKLAVSVRWDPAHIIIVTSSPNTNASLSANIVLMSSCQDVTIFHYVASPNQPYAY